MTGFFKDYEGIGKMKLKETGLTREQIKEKADKYMMAVYSKYDFIAERGRGAYIYDENGEEYLDFIGGIAVNSAGHCNEKVVDAVINQVQDIMHASNYFHTVAPALLAEKICVNTGMDKVIFQNSGSEANEAMIKLARKYGIEKYGPERYNIVTASRSFHGRTMGSLAATGQPDSACHRHFGELVPGFTYAEFNNLKSFEDAVTDNTIAVMVEPIQAEGGVYPATLEFMEGLRDLCDDRGLLLLIDEVQTGWCRTGEVMGYMNYNVKPDAISMAKAIGGGLPIGAMAATEELASYFTPGSHGTTFGGNPVCCAAACAQIDELIGGELKENAKATGNYLMNILRKVPMVKDVRGMGLLIGAEIDESISAAQVKAECGKHKLLVTTAGGNTVRMVPPLTVSKEQCNRAAEIIAEVIEALKK